MNIRIKRDSGYADVVRAYKIMLDGKAVSRVYDGRTVSVEVPPGKHQLYVKLDIWRSNVVDFEAGNSDMLFECGNHLRGWRVFLSLFYAAFCPRSYLWLRRSGDIGSGPAFPAK